jgi:FkbM family methyltransferase
VLAQVRIGTRDIRTVLGAVRQRRHYTALANMFRVYRSPVPALVRYAFGTGRYPAQIPVRTPLGWFSPTLYSHHDLLTLNEIFCRLDYAAGPTARVVVDVGSNIGLSALYFLTRDPSVRCYLFEPVPQNVERLRVNLAGFEERFTLNQCAVGDTAGEFEFGVEGSGRYGGIGRSTGTSIRVPCRSINDILEEVMSREGRVDLLKLDTEGYEVRTVEAMAPEHLKRTAAIYLEGSPTRPLLPAPFIESRYGSVCRYIRSDLLTA